MNGFMRSQIDDAAALHLFGTDGLLPCQATTVTDSKVLLVAGDHASGKSLMLGLFSSWCKNEKVHPIQITARNCSEDGAERIRLVLAALKQPERSGGKSMVLLDQPDLGLSEDYAAAMGQWIAYEVAGMPPNAVGVVVVSHSRALMGNLLSTFRAGGQDAHRMFVGDREHSFDAWLEKPSPKSIEDLLSLSKRSMDLHRVIDRHFETYAKTNVHEHSSS